MSSAPIGIVAEILERREVAVARLSPAAKHQAFPQIYARPIPRTGAPIEAKEFRQLKEENTELKATISGLEAKVESLQQQLDTSVSAIALKIIQRRNAPNEVITVYLDALNAARPDADPYTLGMLVSPRRARAITAPRHVAIWLVRRLCTQMSLPHIGRVFGGRDHTSCMHACARAPFWMQVDKTLDEAAKATIARFGGMP